MSVHASCVKLSHSLLMKSCNSVRGTGLKDHDLDALLGELVAERSASGAGADDYDHTIVVQIEFCHVMSSQLMFC